MLPNLIAFVVEFINSVLSPVPGFARGYVIVFAVGAVLWGLGMGSDSADDAVGQMVQGFGVARSGINAVTDVVEPVLAEAVVVGGKAVASVGVSVGRGVWENGRSLVEVEEAPIKIGPIVEIYGIKIGFIGVLMGLLGLGSLFVFSGDIPILP